MNEYTSPSSELNSTTTVLLHGFMYCYIYLHAQKHVCVCVCVRVQEFDKSIRKKKNPKKTGVRKNTYVIKS